MRLCRLLTIVAFLLSVGAGSVEACCRPVRRGCFANQKTIAGAIEMYNLDFNQAVDVIPWEVLKQYGYLQSIPDDPGEGPGSRENYLLVDGRVFCLRHGTIQGSGNPRQDLRDLGVTDPALLGRAATEAAGRFPDDPPRPGQVAFLPAAAAWFALIAVSPLHAYALPLRDPLGTGP